jgi:hypothetical protein
MHARLTRVAAYSGPPVPACRRFLAARRYENRRGRCQATRFLQDSADIYYTWGPNEIRNRERIRETVGRLTERNTGPDRAKVCVPRIHLYDPHEHPSIAELVFEDVGPRRNIAKIGGSMRTVRCGIDRREGSNGDETAVYGIWESVDDGGVEPSMHVAGGGGDRQQKHKGGETGAGVHSATSVPP